MQNIKIVQESAVKHSKVEPARKLNPQFTVVDGKVVSEQELIEQRARVLGSEKRIKGRTERTERWEGKTHVEILRLEMERIRPGTISDETFSLQVKTDGAIDVHFMGRVFRILPLVVAKSDKGMSWHITAKGALDRLRTAAVRADVPTQMKQGDIYEEQADLLREIAKAAKILEDDELQTSLAACDALGNTSIRWKTEVQTLFLYLIRKLQESPCQTSPKPQRQPKPPAEKGSAPRRQRRKAGQELSVNPRPAPLDEAASQTTTS